MFGIKIVKIFNRPEFKRSAKVLSFLDIPGCMEKTVDERYVTIIFMLFQSYSCFEGVNLLYQCFSKVSEIIVRHFSEIFEKSVVGFEWQWFIIHDCWDEMTDNFQYLLHYLV